MPKVHSTVLIKIRNKYPGRPVRMFISGAWINVVIATKIVIPVSLLNTNPTKETAKMVRQDGNNTVKDLATLEGTPSGSLISSLPL